MNQPPPDSLIARRHPEWREHELRWRWLLDSLEGGQRYRQAIYGRDRKGLPVRNLIRHKREYPDPREFPGASGATGGATYLGGTATGPAGGAGIGMPQAFDQAQFAHDDDYELRRARTPVPTFVPEAVDIYTSKIFATEIDRDLPDGPNYDRIRDWWADVDGRGTAIDGWMEHTIGPLLLVLGQLDLAFDHPSAPVGQVITTEAEALAAGVKRCVATYILPENMVWWRLDARGDYRECLVREYPDGGEQLEGTGEGPLGTVVASSPVRYRHWTALDSTLYDDEGTVLESRPHAFGRVPIVRVFDRRKPRCKNIGQSRLESVAERQREYYNRDSELILSDTTQAHPLLQGPEDWVEADGSVPIGPGWMLAMKRTPPGTSIPYQPFTVVDFPKGAADSLRENMATIRDDADRDAKLMKPAGSRGTGKSTVAQSGVSKQLDHEGLYAALSQISKMFAQAESRALERAATVLFDGAVPPGLLDTVKVSYPTVFSLFAADELATIAINFQGILEAAGNAPETEGAILSDIVRKALPGRDDDTYELYDGEIAGAVKRKAQAIEQGAEGQAAQFAAGPEALPSGGPPGPPDAASEAKNAIAATRVVSLLNKDMGVE